MVNSNYNIPGEPFRMSSGTKIQDISPGKTVFVCRVACNISNGHRSDHLDLSVFPRNQPCEYFETASTYHPELPLPQAYHF